MRVGLAVAFSTLAALAVVGDGGAPAPVEAPVAPAAPAPELPGPPVMPTSDVRAGMAAAATWDGTATWTVFTDGGGRAAVTLARLGERSRVDVVTSDGATASLLRTDAGWVACTTTTTSECLLVAAADAPVPAAFDPGVSGLLGTTLPALAQRTEGLEVTRELPVARALAPAQCAAASGDGAGEYCVTNAGLLRRARFEGGRMNLLTATTDQPAAEVFTPPAPPVPLA